MVNSKLDVSIVIVNFETPKDVENLIESIFKTVKKTKFEIIVVDNSNNADLVFKTKKKFVKVFKIENKGFGNACNFGALKAESLNVLFINADVVVNEKTIDDVFEFFKSKEKIGAVGVRQVRENGEFDAGCKRGFPTPFNAACYYLKLDKIFQNVKIFGGYHRTDLKENCVQEIECISGAFFLIKKEVFHEIGGFDEKFFMYGEDVDLCYRLKEKGFINQYYGVRSVKHLKAKHRKKDLKIVKCFYDAMVLFYDLHYREKYGFFVNLIVKLGIKIKFNLHKIKFNLKRHEKLLKRN